MNQPQTTVSDTSLQIRRTFQTTVTHLFDCFTDPALVCQWWGPKGTRCPSAQIDLSVGGQYRLEILSDTGVLNVVNGEYLTIERPRCLIFTWYWDASPEEITRVTLRFQALTDQESELHLLHEQFPDSSRASLHSTGWGSSFESLADLIGDTA